MARRRRLLVPEAVNALERLKAQVIADQTSKDSQSKSTVEAQPTSAVVDSQTDSVSTMAHQLGIPYRSQASNGDMKASDAGKLGGHIGGPMVKRLIELAETQLEGKRQ